LAEREISAQPDFLLAALPPTSAQRQSAFAVVAALLMAFGVTAPFATVQLPRIDAFIPAIEGIFCVNDLITAVLLFSQFSIIRSRGLLALANGYLFTALIIIPHLLTFPGVFAPTGLLGAGLETAPWLYAFWHFGLPIALLVYAWAKPADRAKNLTQISARSAIGWSVALVIGLVCGLVWLTTLGHDFLPPLMASTINATPLLHYLGTFALLTCMLSLALLWIRRRSVLDQWLLVVGCALTAELVFTLLLISTRYSLGFYMGRIFSLVTSVVVLVVLLAEMTRLYARLAGSNAMLMRERENKLMNLEAMVASISHEVKQPLTAIATGSMAASRFLRHAPPNVEEVQLALDHIIAASRRASGVFDNIRALFGSAEQLHVPIDVNRLVQGALSALRGELDGHGVTPRTELTAELPSVMGHPGQLQGVLLNLASNAIEAMDAVEEGSRVLRVTTQRDGHDAISVTVQDTGPGIAPEKLDSIFDAFVTTKSHGMGLGLAICRMIIQRHGGQLSARSDKKKGGALFQFTLPIGPMAGSIH
jgi:signal transduction histidine kinase